MNGEKPPFRLPGFLNNPLIPGTIVVLLTLIVYGQILGFSFVNYDDGTNIFNNPYFRPVTAQSIGYLWTHGYNDLYTPVTSTIWGLCSYLFPIAQPIFVPGPGNASVNPAAFHALSLLLHSANSLLIFLLLSRVVKNSWPACVGALIFSLHPAQVESVAWVTGMNNLTSGFFGLLALCFYVASAADRNGSSRGAAWLKYGVATLFFILALLSKPTAVAIPLVAAALDWGALGRPLKQSLRLLIPWFLLALALTVITAFTSENSQKLHLALWFRPFIAGDALAYYLSKLIWPFNLSLLNAGRTMYLVKASWWGYVTWLFPLAVGLLLRRTGQPARRLQTGVLIFVLSLLPMLGLVVFYGMALSTVASRYLYLPMLGAGLAAAWFAGSEQVKPVVRAGICGVVLIFLAIRTLSILPSWKDTLTLAKAQVEMNPSNPITQANYGAFLGQKGDLLESIRHFRAAIALKPDEADYHYELGATLEDTGDLPGALTSLRESVRLDPRVTEAQVNLGGVLLKLGQNQEAVATLKKASEIAPNDPSTGYLLGIALASVQRYPEAEAQFLHVVSISPQMAKAQQALGRVLEKQGHREQAARVYQEILKLRPEDAEAKKGLTRTQSASKQGHIPQ